MTSSQIIELLGQGLLETLYMVIVSAALAYVLGLPLGILLVVTDENGIKPKPVFNKVLGIFVNIVRSIPFIILLVWVTPVTRALIGTTLGPTATIVPLVFASAPYIARMVEASLKEVDAGVVEAAQSMGATPMQIVTKVLLPEAKPALIVGAAIAAVTILGYTAMSGFTGGGGLGTVAINYGYYRYKGDIMMLNVIVIVIVVQVMQEIGMHLARRSDKRAR
ncbi:MAG TPA: methionine ABC transporter permease [Clostridia bacterium]|nr:methionine ABC transporter permease [Clostridia bacterium]